MSSIFLGPLRSKDLPAVYQKRVVPPTGGVFVSSGRVALRLLIKSLGLRPGSRIALPPLICDTVTKAILKEKMVPDFVDISPDHFFMVFDKDHFAENRFDLILLPHLYGVLHPQTQEIMDFAAENNIPLIHDAAQSFGLTYQDKPIIEHNQGGFYSFGAGKATTAATGALVYGLDDRLVELYRLNEYRSWDPFSTNFLKERSGSRYWRVLIRFHRPGFQASVIQVKAAQYVLDKVATIEAQRQTNWQFLNKAVGPDIYSVGFQRASYYKFVLYSKPHLTLDQELSAIPMRTFTKQNVPAHLPNYDKMSGFLYELSTERSLGEYQALA